MATTSRAVVNSSLFQKTILPGGIRVITEKLPSVHTVSIGLWVDVGSRNEKPEEYGLSHFIEHMVFKGTRNRNTRQIGSSLESLGGSLNAFTSREHTCFVARILDEHLEEAVDVLTDMVCNATFSPTNIKREKTVVLEEIKESDDTPSDKIHDNFNEIFWGSNPLAHGIMGTRRIIGNAERRDVLKYYRRQYRRGSIMVSAAGSISHRKLVRLIEQKLNLPDGEAETPPPARRSKSRSIGIERSDGFQTHLCLGFPGIAYGDKERTAMMVLNAHLGAGMSSVLFQRIREERGLAYNVYTFQDYYRDAGIFGAYVGTDDKHVRPAFDLMMAEFRKMKNRRIRPDRLAQLKMLIKGHISIAMESTTTRQNRIARGELMTGDYLDSRRILRRIDRVTALEVRDLANRIFDESQMALAVLGPVRKNLFDDIF